MKCDYHVHTYYSDDSEYRMEDMILDAIDMGLDEVAITDHVDYGIKEDPENYYEGCIPNVNYPLWNKELEYLKEKYKEKIIIRKGMEFGIQVHTIPLFEKLYKRFDFDFILLSIHQVEDKEFWTGDYQKGRTQEEYNRRYYEELLNVIKNYHDYSVLAHLDLIVRYDKLGVYPFENVKDIITEILKIVIKEEKGIEVNTSSFRYGLVDLQPSRDILKLYKELGGTIITIGSDTHKSEHLGTHIEDIQEELKTLGFQYFYTFDHMIPIPHEL